MTTPDEAAEADVQEQQTPLTDEAPVATGEIPDEASEADVADQRLEVALDEEDAPIG